jgi:hypothetical protein
MAVPVETFEGYSNGNNLNTLNGGSGWAGAWSETSAGRYVISNAAAESGSLSVRHSSVGVNGIEPEATRTFTDTLSGGEEMVFSVMRDVNSNVDTNAVAFRNGTTTACYFNYNNSVWSVTHSGGTETVVASATAGQWYEMKIKFASGSTFEWAVDGGAYSSAKTYLNSVSTGINNIRFSIGAGNNGDYIFYVDSIGEPGAGGAAADPSKSNLPLLNVG